MALVGGSGEDGGGRYALVKARGGAVLADGDEAFGDRAAALAAFERARDLGWALHATPGLAAELAGSGSAVASLDPAALAETAAGGRERRSCSRRPRPRATAGSGWRPWRSLRRWPP